MTQPGIPIPLDALTAATIRSLVEAFITREGTDYGRVEIPLEIQVERAIQALESGDVLIMFDPATETTTLVKKEALPTG